MSHLWEIAAARVPSRTIRLAGDCLTCWRLCRGTRTSLKHSEGWKWCILKVTCGTPHARWRDVGSCRLSSPVVQKHDDADEAFAFCSLCCVCVWRSERAADCLATISG